MPHHYFLSGLLELHHYHNSQIWPCRRFSFRFSFVSVEESESNRIVREWDHLSVIRFSFLTCQGEGIGTFELLSYRYGSIKPLDFGSSSKIPGNIISRISECHHSLLELFQGWNNCLSKPSSIGHRICNTRTDRRPTHHDQPRDYPGHAFVPRFP